MAKHYVYQFYAELRDYKPLIWRRFQINGEKTMAELAYVLMIMFEMQASHLFRIEHKQWDEFVEYMKAKYPGEDIHAIIDEYNDGITHVNYAILDEDDHGFLRDGEATFDADETTIQQVTTNMPFNPSLWYDFGDDWFIDLKLESVERKEISLSALPMVLEGAGYGIIEDVGGVCGLEEFAKAMKKGKGATFDEYFEWIGKRIDISAFDMDDINFRIKKLLRVYRDIYEYGIEPSRQMIKVLERDYLR